MKHNSRVLLLLCATAALSFSNCSKKQTQGVDNETQSSVDNAIADQEFMSLVPAAYHCALNTPKLTGKAAGNNCDSLRYINGDTLFNNALHTDPKFLVPLNCQLVLNDGKARTDSLFVSFSGKPGTAGTKMTLSMKGYKSGGISYSCDKLEATLTAASSTLATFNAKLVNGKCESSSFLIRYNSERTLSWYPGTTPYSSVFGTGTGTNRSGRSFTVSIPEGSPLVKYANCEYVGKGSLELTPDGYDTRQVDFGNGACDIEATFSIKGNVVAFKLK